MSRTLSSQLTNQAIVIPGDKLEDFTLAEKLALYDVNGNPIDITDGIVGIPGPQGDEGPQGPQGLVGPAGPEGPRGPEGAEGAQGDAGVGSKGDQGDIGPTGPKGDTGDQGLPGAKGDSGAKGDPGAPGAAGAVGANGIAGQDGPQGAQGPVGATGAVGPKGDKGDKGDTGTAGANGPQGVAGTAGGVGPQGNVGPQGPIGPAGPKGDSGAEGPPGEAASILLDPWHNVGVPGEPQFQGTWANVPGGEPLRFRKDPMGRVWVQGNIGNGGSGTVAFPLPVGYRPPRDRVFDSVQSNAIAGTFVFVTALSGNVALTYTNAPLYVDFSFDTETVSEMPSGPAGPAGPPYLPIVNTLPGAPFDGQEVLYRTTAMGYNGPWRLRYRADSPSMYKWEFLSGEPFSTALVDGVVNIDAWAMFGASLVTPREGYYKVWWTTSFYNPALNAPNGLVYTGPYINGVRNDAFITSYGVAAVPGGTNHFLTTPPREVFIPVGQSLRAGAVATAGGWSAYGGHQLFMSPIRVM